MKTNILRKTILSFFVVLTPLLVSSHDFEADGIYYNITSSTDLTVAVTFRGDYSNSYSNEYTGTVTIPVTVTYDGVAYSVTSIGEYAFCDCSNLTAINILENSQLTSIGKSAFNGCSNLTAITIPENSLLMSIEDYAFRSCTRLTDINVPERVTSIGSNAFHGCASLTAITIPKGVTSIENFLFSDCVSLTTINIPESLTSIGENAFFDCSSLTDITIPGSVTSIAEQAFSGCYNLINITCKAEIPPTIGYSDIFYDKSIYVYVPASSAEAYKAAVFWKGFSILVIAEEPLSQCATPIISYKGGRVKITCETKEAVVKTKLDIENDMAYESLEFDLIPTYTLTAYATKDQYEDSDVAALTICWIPCDENHGETNGILTIPSKPVLISARDGVLTLCGLAEDTTVTLYTTDGVMVAQQQSNAGEAKFAVDTNQVYIVHIGDKVVKIGM